MKRIFAGALALLLFVAAAQAQDGGRHHNMQGGKIVKELNLTADQKAKLKSLHEAERAEMRTLQGSADKAQRKAVHEKYKAQYEAILTPAQREEWNKKKEEWKNDREDGRGAPGDEGRFGQMAGFYKKELNLTSDQEAKLKNIYSEFRSKAADVRANQGLNQEQKKAQMRSLVEQHMTRGKAVLTPEQVQKLEQVQRERKHKRNRNS